jgi:serine/threonine protein phosphatase PrpC
MHVSVRPFWCPKAGHSKEEYEDELSHRRKAKLRKEALHFAIADGATESSFSNVWARLLVKSNSRAPLNRNNVQQRIKELGKRWEQRTAKPLPWYAERKRQQGSFAAFLGLSLEEKGTWSAFAVGDSCLFQVRNDSLMTCFPIERSDQFRSQRAIRKPDLWYHDGDHAVLMRSNFVCHDVRFDPIQPSMRPI